MNQWIAVGALALMGVGIPVAMIVVSSLIRPSVPEQGKSSTYESGEIPTESAIGIQFNAQYYMVALLFMIFDIETVLLFPWTVIYRPALEAGVGLAAVLFPMLVFIGVLVIGLVWAWRQGAVKWTRSEAATQRKTEHNS